MIRWVYSCLVPPLQAACGTNTFGLFIGLVKEGSEQAEPRSRST
jgi:hypothetical protein